MKKLVSFALCIVLVLSFSVVAFASSAGEPIDAYIDSNKMVITDASLPPYPLPPLETELGTEYNAVILVNGDDKEMLQWAEEQVLRYVPCIVGPGPCSITTRTSMVHAKYVTDKRCGDWHYTHYTCSMCGSTEVVAVFSPHSVYHP